MPPPILHTDSSGGLQRAAGAGSLHPHSTWEKASPPCLVTAEQHRWLSPLKPGHVPAPPARKPLAPPPKGVSLSERSRIKWESASQLLCSQPLSLRLSNRSPARLRATLQIYPQRPRQRHTLPPSQGGGGGSCQVSPPFSCKVSLHLCWGKGFIRGKQHTQGGCFPHHLLRPAWPLLRSRKIPTWNTGNGLTET